MTTEKQGLFRRGVQKLAQGFIKLVDTAEATQQQPVVDSKPEETDSKKED
jgi:hypothetical protein